MASRFAFRVQVIARAIGHLAATRLAATTGRRAPSAAPKRILIAHHLLLGDTIMLTPLVAKLRERHPDAEIVMTVPRAYAPLYAGRPYGVAVLPYNPRDAASFPAAASARGFDLAYVPGDNRYSWLAAALGSRWIVAFAGDRPAYKSWPVDEQRMYSDTPMAWGDMVAQLADGPAPAPYHLSRWPAPPCKPFARPEGRYCVFHLGASSALKFWPTERWATFADLLAAEGYRIVFTPGRGEEHLVRAVDPQGRHTSLDLDLAQLWHLLAGASLVVSPDTGVAHLARLVGAPAVTLFGPGAAQLFGAGEFWRNSPWIPVTAPDFPCRDQRKLFKRELAWVRRCVRSTRECARPACMDAISVKMVRDAADKLLAASRAGAAVS